MFLGEKPVGTKVKTVGAGQREHQLIPTQHVFTLARSFRSAIETNHAKPVHISLTGAGCVIAPTNTVGAENDQLHEAA